MKCKIKVLPLTFPFDQSNEWSFWRECDIIPITPVFNRDGFYLDRITNGVWFEKEGEAFLYGDREWFEQECYMIDNAIMDDRLFDALETVVSFRMATPKQRNLLYLEGMKRQCSYIRRNARKFRISCDI